jgi:hypothetical protein
MLGRQALEVASAADDWSKGRAGLARVYAAQVLAQAPGAADGVMAGGADLEAMSAEALAG